MRRCVNGVLTQGLKARRSPASHRLEALFSVRPQLRNICDRAVIEQHYGWKVAAPFYALGGYVSLSRMVDNQHWASDVIFGAAVGIVWAAPPASVTANASR